MAIHTLILPDGSAITSGKPGIAIRRVAVTSRIWEGREVKPGAVCAVMAEIEIMDASTCPLGPGEEFILLKDGAQVGVFLVEEAIPAGFACWQITAFDRVRKLDKEIPLPEEICSLGELAQSVCKMCGVSLAEEGIPHPSACSAATFPKGEGNNPPLWGGWPSKARSGEVTGRQVMKAIAKEMGCFARANQQGEIEFIRPEQPAEASPV